MEADLGVDECIRLITVYTTMGGACDYIRTVMKVTLFVHMEHDVCACDNGNNKNSLVPHPLHQQFNMKHLLWTHKRCLMNCNYTDSRSHPLNISTSILYDRFTIVS